MRQATCTALLCLHCGNPVLGATTRFCCNGCAAVYALLIERGLGDYYALRNKADSTPITAPQPQDKAEAFDYLDDPAFVADYAVEVPGGKRMRIYLEGAHCAACVWLTEKLPEMSAGVNSLRLDLSSGVATVELNEKGSFAEAAAELSRLGYRPHPVRQGEAEALRRRENRQHLIQLGIAGMASGNIMLLAIALYAGADGSLSALFRWVSFALYLPVLLYSALPFYRSAGASLRNARISIDVPIVFGLLIGTVASVANLIAGSPHVYFDSLSALVFLLLCTRYLLRKVNERASAMTELMHFLAPSRSRVWNAESSAFCEARTDSLRAGDLVQVLAGECIPVDGVIERGEGFIDCSLLTGESEPVAVALGMIAHAGTWNRSAPLELRVNASGAKTRLGAIIAAMNESLDSKAPIVSQLDRVGQSFVAAVLVLTALGFFLGLSEGWHEAVNRALAVAIVVCPCTFALATPLAFSLAMGRCARNGVLIRNAEVLERLSHVREAFLDKTGTLTSSERRVLDWEARLPGALEALLALESRSVHPVATAVLSHFPAPKILPPVEGFRETAGVGVSGTIAGAKFEARAMGSKIALLQDGRVAGLLTLSDELRPDTPAAVARLRALGLKLRILSGDSNGSVYRVARALGIELRDAIATASPEEKAQTVREAQYGMMVGDGANDAVALAAAYVGIAVRGGMEASIRAAGAYCTRPGLSGVTGSLIVARETMRVIRRNLAFAIFYNIVGVSVALSGHLDPLFAAVLMPASALTVVLSTLAGTSALRRAFA